MSKTLAAMSTNSGILFAPSSQTPQPASATRNGLRQLAAFFFMDSAQGTELQITQQHTRQGIVQWLVYNPMTQQRLSFDSEDVLRAWVDTRHHR